MGGDRVPWGLRAPAPTAEPGARRDHFRCYKGPSRSKAGAAWILTAAIHLQGQGDEALHSFSATLPPRLGNTDKAGRPASPGPAWPPLPPSCPWESSLACAPAPHLGTWPWSSACRVGRGTTRDPALPPVSSACLLECHLSYVARLPRQTRAVRQLREGSPFSARPCHSMPQSPHLLTAPTPGLWGRGRRGQGPPAPPALLNGPTWKS